MTGVISTGAGLPGYVTHPAWIEVDVDALVSNARVLRSTIPAWSRLGILVKANAYGHGLVMGARAAIEGGADQLIVAALDEALALRSADITAPVLVVYPVLPSAVGAAAEAGIELSVSGPASARQVAEAWARLAVKPAEALRVHVEVDSGMARGGARPASVIEVFEILEQIDSAEIIGLWSHLADGSSHDTSARQVREFEAAANIIRASGRRLPPRHLAASEGVFVATSPSYEMVRIGLAFYGELGLGVEPAPIHSGAAQRLRSAMTVKARAVHLEVVPEGGSVGYGGEWTAERPSLIATLPVGYADGWSRLYWPSGSVLVQGQRAPIAGRISMDSMCVDVTDIPDVTLEDEFVLLGRQGTEQITANELARMRRSIPNEVLASLGPRLPRVYLGSLTSSPTETAR